MTTMNRTQVIAKLNEAKGERSLREYARTIGISHSFLRQVLEGIRPPGPKVLAFMGLREIATTTVIYVPIPAESSQIASRNL